MNTTNTATTTADDLTPRERANLYAHAARLRLNALRDRLTHIEQNPADPGAVYVNAARDHVMAGYAYTINAMSARTRIAAIVIGDAAHAHADAAQGYIEAIHNGVMCEAVAERLARLDDAAHDAAAQADEASR